MTMQSTLEHANITVSDVHATAAMLHDIFGWKTRWSGASIHGGYTAHVGSAASYLALYAPPRAEGHAPESYYHTGSLNHVGIVVEDFEATEAKVKAAGYEPHNHADYEPGRRFYFHDGDGIEYEVVSYS